jgi:hypothetical protein
MAITKIFSKKTLLIIVSIITCIGINAFIQSVPLSKPWDNKPQQIPGKVECELYDIGGEGIAYADKDSVNNGSGILNPANGTFLNEFRMHEGVDISYTKANDVDNNKYNIIEPKLGQLYVGWTNPGEWINYTVDVKKAGEYCVTLMYTSNGAGVIAIDVDGKETSGAIHVTTTHVDSDTVAWRQWHHWNQINCISKIKLEAGKHILTLKTLENGNMNYDYLEFTESK